jgi:hypothetical protein
MLALALTAAAAAPYQALPLPPIPPAAGPPDRTAPVPDVWAQQPASETSHGTELAPNWFTQKNYSSAQGFTPGSQIDAPPDRHVPLAPEINLRVPLK